MPSQVHCPKCRHGLTIADGPAARDLRCPRCDTVIRAAASTVGDPPTALSPMAGAPRSIGPYAVRRQLGEGAFGVVYLCHDADLDRDLAVKVLRPSALGSDKHVQRFLREAKVVAKLLHGNIGPVFQLGRHEGGYFIASAFIPGRPLADVIPEEGMDPGRAVRLTMQLLDALAYAHERGVLHRDVKPANAMVVEEGGEDTLYLMDFGLAGLLDAGDARMTKDNTVMGTPSYMPPEQARGAVKEIGPASDQYSAGVVLYELLTGRVPFEALSTHAVIGAVIHAPPPPPSGIRPGLDWTLEAICLKALAKKPEDRFGCCREFADVLGGWLANRPAAAPAVQKAVPPSLPPPRKRPPAVQTMVPARLGATLPAPPSVQRGVAVAAPTPEAPSRPRWWLGLVVAACLCVVVVPAVAVTCYFAWRPTAPTTVKQSPPPKAHGVRDEINDQNDTKDQK